MPQLERAGVGSPSEKEVTDERVCDTAWLWDNDPLDKVVPVVSKRIELITGLSTQYKPIRSSAEPFQLVNYGLAGQYEPHFDFFEKQEDLAYLPEFLANGGDRIVTFMLYLTEVTEGGATVFPYLNIRIPPIKNGAAFWFNIKPSGELDRRTQHAGCPVLLGEKWVANKWIREYDQMFRRPCGLSPDYIYPITL